MGALIDTSVLAAAERGQLDLVALVSSRSTEWFGIAAITASELLAGVEWPGRPEHLRASSQEFVDRVLATVPVVTFDLAIARTHARLYASLKAAKAKIHEHDLQIAATAITLRQPVATRDARSFPLVPGLTVETW